MAGACELARYENQLSLFPQWLSFLTRIKTLRFVAGFAVQYWFYAQLDSLGRLGKAQPEMSVFAATKSTMAGQEAWLENR